MCSSASSAGRCRVTCLRGMRSATRSVTPPFGHGDPHVLVAAPWLCWAVLMLAFLTESIARSCVRVRSVVFRRCRALPRPRRVLARDHRARRSPLPSPGGGSGVSLAGRHHDTGSTPSADPFTLWRRYERRARRADRRGADRRDHRRPDAERRAHVDEYVSTERADLRRARRGHALGDRGARLGDPLSWRRSSS